VDHGIDSRFISGTTKEPDNNGSDKDIGSKPK
jgi:hypothetical protein